MGKIIDRMASKATERSSMVPTSQPSMRVSRTGKMGGNTNYGHRASPIQETSESVDRLMNKYSGRGLFRVSLGLARTQPNGGQDEEESSSSPAPGKNPAQGSSQPPQAPQGPQGPAPLPRPGGNVQDVSDGPSTPWGAGRSATMHQSAAPLPTDPPESFFRSAVARLATDALL